MRNYIISSIANVIRRYRAEAVDMLRFENDSMSHLWQQVSAVVQPAGGVSQKRHGRLLTVTATNAFGINPIPFAAVAEILNSVSKRLNVEPNGRNGQLCPITPGSLGSSRVS